MEETVSARVNISPYVNKVLGIIKLKYDLKDKSEALNKFVELYGEEVVEKEVSDDYMKKIIELTNNHYKKYGARKMSLEELDALLE